MNLSKIKYLVIILSIVILGTSCKKDNYEAPSITLQGRLMYNGEAINVQHNSVSFQLFQSGYNGAQNGTFSQEGTYSALLFAGNYRFLIPVGQGPFRWNENSRGGRDTLAVNLTGDQTLDINVTPYYLVRNANYTVSSRNVTANFSVAKIITDNNARNIERVSLYVSKTQFVSDADKITDAPSLSGANLTNMNNLSLTLTVPTITPTQAYVFARVGIKVEGIEDMIFSPLTKINL